MLLAFVRASQAAACCCRGAVVVLVIAIIASQLIVHAQASLSGTAPPNGIDGALQPSTWLTKALLQRIATILPLSEASIRGRLVQLNKQAALPELIAISMRQIESGLADLHKAVAASLAPQRQVHDAAVRVAKEEEKVRQEALKRDVESAPESLVGKTISFYRAATAKWCAGTILGYVAERGSHTVQFAGEPAQSELLMRNEKYQLKPAPLPTPTYTWTAAVDEALARVCRLQHGLQEKVAEWHKLGMPAELHGAVSVPPPSSSDAPTTTDHPDFKALIVRISKFWPSKWMTVAKILKQFKSASAQQAAAAKAAGAPAKAVSPPKAASPQPPPAQPQAGVILR